MINTSIEHIIMILQTDFNKIIIQIPNYLELFDHINFKRCSYDTYIIKKRIFL